MKPLAVQMELTQKRLTVLCKRAELSSEATNKFIDECLDVVKATYSDGILEYPLTREKAKEMATVFCQIDNLPEDIAEQMCSVLDYHLRWANATGLLDQIDPRLQSIRPELLSLLEELDKAEA